MRTVQLAMGGEITTIDSQGPLGQKVEAKVLCLPNAQQPDFVYIESSEACGHHLVHAEERDAMRASSHGLGLIILGALQRWHSSLKRIFVGLGDSATSDVGMGMLGGLGYSFYDTGGRVLWGNAETLRLLHAFEPPRDRPWEKVRFTVLCDVLNPLLGPHGSARTFSRQKGASPGQVSLIEQGMEHFVSVIQKTLGHSPRYEPMTGSAGGLSAAFKTFFDAELVHGARFLLDWIGFDRILDEVAFLITGEGRTDYQTMSGKAPMECLERAGRMGKRSLVISGALADGYEPLLRRPGVMGVFACGQDPSAKQALTSKVLDIFSGTELVSALTEP